MKLSVIVILSLFILFIAGSQLYPKGKVIYKSKSKYSNILVKENKNTRKLYFLNENSKKQTVQSAMNMKHPYKLILSYSKVMFASHLFHKKPKRCLIVGLGAGSMIKFLNHYFPNTYVDVLEIDPEVVKVAKKYFELKITRKCKVIVGDGYQYIQKTSKSYDIIYMDVFLTPSEGTDSRGIPLTSKTLVFYNRLKSRLNKGGLVVFNLIGSPHTKRDIKLIAKAFPHIYQFPVPKMKNIIIVAPITQKEFEEDELEKNGAKLDKKLDTSFSFKDLTSLLD